MNTYHILPPEMEHEDFVSVQTVCDVWVSMPVQCVCMHTAQYILESEKEVLLNNNYYNG